MKVIRLDRRLYGIKSPFYSELLKDIAKETPGVVWHRAARAWVGYADGVMAVVARLQAEGCRVDIRALPEPASQQTTIQTFVPIADKGLRDYQKLGVRFLVDQGPTGAVLADEMSLGKTIQTIRAARAFRLKLLVVCPSYARGVWSRPPSSAFPGELAKWWPKALPCAALEGVRAASTIVRPTKKQLALRNGLPCKLARDSQNYEGLPLHAKVAVVHYEIAYAWVDALLAWGEGRLMVVFDEIHQAGNPRSRMWQALRMLSENAKVSIGLTGTPLQNHIEDLWNVVELVSPGRFSNPLELDRRSFFDYGMRHAGGHPEQVTPEKVVYKWDGKTNQEELKARLEYMILRRTKKSVKLQLPPLERQVIDVEVPPQARVIARAEIFKKSRLARQCLDLAANAKLPKVVELLQRHAEQGLRVVAATHRRNIAEWLCTQMTARKIKAGFVHGGVSFRNRDKRIDLARSLRGSSEGHVLCCTMDSTKSSIDLSYADVGVVVEFDWNPATHRQWEARISRFGSTSARTLFQYVVGRGTTDEIVIERLLDKLRTFDETVGSLDDTFGEDIDTRAKGDEALAELAAAIRKRQREMLLADEGEAV